MLPSRQIPSTVTYRRWLFILFTLLFATALLAVCAIPYAMKIVLQPGYPESTFDPAVAIQDNALRWHDRSCDVLVYGDSTANVGIDPRVITARTGLSACNIAASRPVVDDLDTIPLDAFLRHNPKPRLIVLQFGPEVFYRARSPWEHAGPYTPMLMLARDLPRAFAFRTMLRHPAQTTQFVSFILQNRFFPRHVDADRLGRNYHRAMQHSEESGGQLDLELPAQTACLAPALPLYGAVDAAWIRQLHQKYEVNGITVLVRAAPIPSCDPQLAQFRRELVPYVDGNVDALPITSFTAGDRHTTQQGSEAETLGLVDMIQLRYPNSPRNPNAGPDRASVRYCQAIHEGRSNAVQNFGSTSSGRVGGRAEHNSWQVRH